MTTELLMKVRRGSVSSFNHKQMTELFSVLSGFGITKKTEYRRSNGGQYITEIPGYNRSFHVGPVNNRVTFKTVYYSDYVNDAIAAKEKEKYDHLKNVVAPTLKTLETSAPVKGRNWYIDAVLFQESFGAHGENTVTVSFEFYVKCSVYVITTTENTTYDVFTSDYKNEIVCEQTFPMFFKWALDNTDLMEQVLTILDMEPYETKEQKEKFVPKKTDSEETKRVYNDLLFMTTSLRDEQIKQTDDLLCKNIKFFMEHANKEELFKRLDRVTMFVLSQVYNRRKMILADDWQERVHQFSVETVDDMQRQFVSKNTRKLAPILTKKGNLSPERQISFKVVGGVIEGSMLYKFTDGASFRVTNQTVCSFSSKGLRFYRFPTTFHDVVMSNGMKMHHPSEENMNTVFE